VSFIFNGIQNDSIRILKEFERPAFAPINHEVMYVPGVPGGYIQETSRQIRLINIPVEIKPLENLSLFETVEKIVSWLTTEEDVELVLPGEPNRTYYARLTGDLQLREILNRGKGTIQFICPDPYKYGPTKKLDFTNGILNVFNNGTINAAPVVEVVVLEDISYLDFFNDKGYMRIGRPMEIGQTIVNKYERMLNDSLATLVGWSNAGLTVDGGDVTGAFTVVNGEFVASSYDTGTTWHGPAVKKSIPNAPIVDFEVEYRLKFPTIAGGLGRIELYLLDDQSQTIGKLSMKRINEGFGGNTVEVRLGNGLTSHMLVNYAGADNRSWDNFNGIIRLSREGNVWTAYIARIDPNTSKHIVRYGATYTDTGLLYTNNLSQVQLHIAQNGTSPVPKLAIADLRIDRINNVSPTGPYVIATTGDVIKFDHAKSELTINGEDAKRLKDFGATFFDLPRGVNALLLEPSDKVSATLSMREGYL
jgi:predicted phage tail component-like protein